MCVQINGVMCSHLVEFHVLLLHDGLVAPTQTIESDFRVLECITVDSLAPKPNTFFFFTCTPFFSLLVCIDYSEAEEYWGLGPRNKTRGSVHKVTAVN